MVIQTPIISSIVVSIDSWRIGAIRRSTSAPRTVAVTMAASNASRKFGASALMAKNAA
jgi:hypothetical protein